MAAPVYRTLPVKQAMNRVSAPGMPFECSLNPYRGCWHGCAFCYARATHTFLGLTADDSFQHQIHTKDDAPRALRDQLERLWHRSRGDVAVFQRKTGLIAVGTATDPYQPVEGKRQLTRRCLEVLADYPVRVTITTRSPLILRDLDVLARLRPVAIHISVHTLDPHIWRSLEPGSPPPHRRLETIRGLVQHGLPAGAFVAPMLPKLTDDDATLHHLGQALAEAGARFAVPSMLRLADEVKPWFLHVLRQAFPRVVPLYEALYRGRQYPPAAWVDQVLARAERILAQYGLNTRSYEHHEHAPQERMMATEDKHSKSVQLLLPI